MTVLPAESDPGQDRRDEQRPPGPTGDDPPVPPVRAAAPPVRAVAPPVRALRPLAPPVAQPEHSIAPRTPRTAGGVVFLAVLATTVLGVLIVVAGRVQTGLSTVGGAFLAGALARLVLPGQQAGMLGVRRKLIDVSTMTLLGAGLLVVAVLIREPAA